MTNEKNGNTYYRYLSPNNVLIKLTKLDYEFSISIDNPKRVKSKDKSSYIFRLRNEEELEQYLLELQFPFFIEEVYKKLCEISLEPVTKYPKLLLKVEKPKYGYPSKRITTDFIGMQNGQVFSFTITRNCAKISVDNEKGWHYQGRNIVAWEYAKHEYYSYSPNRSYNNRYYRFEKDRMGERVQEVREIRKTLFKK